MHLTNSDNKRARTQHKTVVKSVNRIDHQRQLACWVCVCVWMPTFKIKMLIIFIFFSFIFYKNNRHDVEHVCSSCIYWFVQKKLFATTTTTVKPTTVEAVPPAPLKSHKISLHEYYTRLQLLNMMCISELQISCVWHEKCFLLPYFSFLNFFYWKNKNVA